MDLALAALIAAYHESGESGALRAVLPLAHNNAAGLNSGREIGVHPQLAGFKTLFDAGRGAIVSNVGPLIVPLTKAQYGDRNVPKPPALFSHNDQTSTWMAFAPEGARVGWGGRMGDPARSSPTELSAHFCPCRAVCGSQEGALRREPRDSRYARAPGPLCRGHRGGTLPCRSAGGSLHRRPGAVGECFPQET